MGFDCIFFFSLKNENHRYFKIYLFNLVNKTVVVHSKARLDI